MSLSVALTNALTGLSVNQRALDVTAQNVANVNTPGYSRKIVNQSALVLGGQGAGVEIADIARRVNEFMLKDMRSAISGVSSSEVTDEFYGRMQDLFGSLQSQTSTGALIGNLATAFQAFSVDPQDVSLRIEVINAANTLARQITAMCSSLQGMRLEADRKIADAMTVINDGLDEIQTLNVRISEHRALGLETGDLEDQRDIALSAITEEISVTYFYRDGEMVIYTASGQPLLDRTAIPLSHSAATSMSPLTAYDGAVGAIDTITVGGMDITGDITGGRVAAYIGLRDTTIPNLQSQLEQLATSLTTEINRLHNQGASFPGYDTLTGSRTVASGDVPMWTGTVRIAALDSTGAVVEYTDFDLSTYASIGAFLTAVDGMANVAASIDGNGNVAMSGQSGNTIAINEMTSAVTVGNETRGLSHFLGLNDFFGTSNDYDYYNSAERTSRTSALGLGGTLTFQGSWGTTTVAYGAADTLSTIAALINANATLAGQGITAAAGPNGSGYRLRISDDDGDNFFISDTGTLVSTLNLTARDESAASSIAVRSDILADPSRLAHASLSSSGTLAVADIALTAGDNTVAQELADKFTSTVNFDETGLLAGGARTFTEYGGAIVALNATQAKSATDDLASDAAFHAALQQKTSSISGVNLDEEMANMVVLQNAYAASARVVTTTTAMFDELLRLAG
jgi:flagellar hook-associated protein 1 FlgK